MNLNSQIDWNDTDRIVSNDTRYVSLNGDWWRESSSWQTRQNGSSELTLMGRSRTPTGVTTTYAYDALGRQISQTDGRGYTSQIVYDAQGRVAKTIAAEVLKAAENAAGERRT